tara:strand:+ start:8421 stop:9137 length:717 start_codon:yes stop_codon:yes gene_type:complete
MNKYYFISVRSESTRLKHKALLKINEKATIEYLIENIKKSKYYPNIILCTTDKSADNLFEDIATKHEIKIFRGSSKDKIKRWYDCSLKYDVDFFVNVDGDDLFFDYNLGDKILDEYSTYDFVDGHGYYIDVYGISNYGIKSVYKSKTTNETEYIRTFFLKEENINKVVLENIDEKYFKTDARMTLDYEDDFLFFKNVISNVQELQFDNILNYLKKNPDVKKINYYLEKEWSKNQLKYK